MRSMPRFAATAVTASLALAVLGMPGVALAGGPDTPGARGAAGQPGPAAPGASAADAPGREVAAAVRATPSAAPAGQPAPALPFVGPRAQEVVAADRQSARPAKPAKAARPAKPTAADRPAKAAPPARPAKRVTPAAGKATRTPTAKADPRGNNGTFKVDGPLLDTSRGNEPHVSCAFRLNFFGYDAGQLGRISLTAVAPTPGATTRVDGLPLISTSTAKGGQYDGSYPAAGTLTAGDLGLDPSVAHHVKVRVEAINADGSEVPGGAKSKVFWLEPCAAEQPAAVEGAGSAPVVAPRAVVPAAAPVSGPAEDAVPLAGQPSSAVLAETVSARAAAPVTVLAIPELLVPQSSAQPATLPFTGSPQTLILLLLGIVTLAGGTALLVAVRRTP